MGQPCCGMNSISIYLQAAVLRVHTISIWIVVYVGDCYAAMIEFLIVAQLGAPPLPAAEQRHGASLPGTNVSVYLMLNVIVHR